MRSFILLQSEEICDNSERKYHSKTVNFDRRGSCNKKNITDRSRLSVPKKLNANYEKKY